MEKSTNATFETVTVKVYIQFSHPPHSNINNAVIELNRNYENFKKFTHAFDVKSNSNASCQRKTQKNTTATANFGRIDGKKSVTRGFGLTLRHGVLYVRQSFFSYQALPF